MITTILVVDPCADRRICVGGILKRNGEMSTVYASGNADALAAVERHSPDIVLVALEADEGACLNLVASICRQVPRVPVVLMSNPGAEEIVRKALQQGAASYVTKRHLARDRVLTLDNLSILAQSERRNQRLLGYLTASESSFVLDNDRDLVPVLVGHLLEGLARVNICDEAERIQVGIALGEALFNALYHGNLEVSSSLRHDDERAFFELAEQRRALEPYKDRRIYVSSKVSQGEAVYVIRDQGPGFDITALPDPTDPVNLDKPTGRGVLLIRTFMDEVWYSRAGTEITMVKRRQTSQRDEL